jgi:ABC-type transport system involved in cytochrome bd biosynthesis fused ATPase/permease subunit
MHLLDHKKAYRLVGLILSGALLEIIAVVMLAAILTEQDIDLSIIGILPSFEGTLIACSLIWLFSGLANSLVQYLILRYSFQNGLHLASKLVAISLEKQSDDLSSKSIVDVAVNEIGRVIGGFLIPSFVLFQKLCLLIFTLIFIVIAFGPSSLITVSFVGFVYALISYFVRQKTQRNGKDVSYNNTLRTNILLDIESGSDLLKINQSEKYMINHFAEATQKSYFAQTLNQTYSVLPKYLLETFIVLSLLFFISANGQNTNTSEGLLIIGAVSIKVLPSLQAVFASFTLRSAHQNSWKFVVSEITANQKYLNITEAEVGGYHVGKLRYNAVSLSHNNDFSMTADNIDIEIGKIIGVIGSSGSGKSTFGRALCGLENTALIDFVSYKDATNGIRHEKTDGKILRPTWGYVPQSPFLFDNNLIFNLFHTDYVSKALRHKAQRLLNDFGLLSPQLLEEWQVQKVGRSGKRFSGGETQRLTIASAILRGRKFLFLDEATSALDDLHSQKILDILVSLKSHCGIVFVTHDLRQLKICDEVLEFNNGIIIKRYNKHEILKTFGSI